MRTTQPPSAKLIEGIRACDAAVAHWIGVANECAVLTGEPLVVVPEVRYNLRGAMAGKCCKYGLYLRFNPDLIVAEVDTMVNQIVPHEVAHVVQHAWYDRSHGRYLDPHGPEWRSIMALFGKVPHGFHHLKTRPLRVTRRYPYHCRCDARNHFLSGIQVRRIQEDESCYACKYCGYFLLPGRS